MLTAEEINSVKGRGFLLNRGTDTFSGRVVSVAGSYSTEQLKCIAKCADEIGCGEVIFTSRGSAEIPGIPFDRIPEAESLIGTAGLSFGGTGPKVRPITACKGTTCVYGNIDTQGLAKVLHERFYVAMHDTALPHKFKIGVGGCPNSCAKPTLNDIGIEGHRLPGFNALGCHNCAKCVPAQKCPSGAIEKTDIGAVIHPEKCLECGVCVGKCPFGAFARESESVCTVYAGGTWGKTRCSGIPVMEHVPVEAVPDIVEKAITWYRENGLPKERFRKTIDRIGVDELKKYLSGSGE